MSNIVNVQESTTHEKCTILKVHGKKLTRLPLARQLPPFQALPGLADHFLTFPVLSEPFLASEPKQGSESLGKSWQVWQVLESLASHGNLTVGSNMDLHYISKSAIDLYTNLHWIYIVLDPTYVSCHIQHRFRSIKNGSLTIGSNMDLH